MIKFQISVKTMARRRKAAAAPAQPPRTRRSTRASEAPPVVEKQMSDDASANQDCENDSQDSNQLSFPMILMNHKNFGKYRCLSSKSSGPGDEIINNVEVKIVDPCASSESDSNSVETRLTDSPTVKCFSKYNRSDRGSNSSSPISIKSKIEPVGPTEIQSDNSNNQITLSSVFYDTQLPDPTLEIISSMDPRRSASSMDSLHNILGRISPYLKSDKNSSEDYDFLSDNFASEVTIEDESQESAEKINGEEDMYTIYEIISEDQNNDMETPCIFSNTEPEVVYDSVKTEEKDDLKVQLDKLKLTTDDDTETKKIKRSPKAIKKVTKKKQVNLNKESNSTPNMSEEETKMDIEPVSQTNTEKIDNNYSTDSSSSSSTCIRRSSRIKTISIQKQRSKGHGLVKGSQKNISNTLNKDNKASDGDPTKSQDASQTVSNSQNSPIFPVPISDSEIRPVKVKSRWRRSSEMEMGSRSPVTPPLSSPNSNNKLSDNASTDQKTSVDEAIQARLNQFQIIFENEYHCDRAVSKEAKKMICDCFLTKEEIERGELGCGEDCLNRLLMIEW